ncbi:Uncharacterised protein [Streptococcus pneumoniae]|nr:Uncharacterised protein [Streptococcus pneumoniae]
MSKGFQECSFTMRVSSIVSYAIIYMSSLMRKCRHTIFTNHIRHNKYNFSSSIILVIIICSICPSNSSIRTVMLTDRTVKLTSRWINACSIFKLTIFIHPLPPFMTPNLVTFPYWSYNIFDKLIFYRICC